MRKLLICKLFTPILVSAVIGVASAQQSYVAGPIDRVDQQGGQLSVLGHSISVDASTELQLRGKKVAALQGLKQLLSPGTFVYAEFNTSGKFARATAIATLSDLYVTGASEVYMGDRITRVDVRNGRIEIGSLVVDVSAVSPEIQSQLTMGTFVEISGIQPVRSGIVVGAKIFGVGGSGALGVGGSGKQGVGGSGKLGVGGSGALGIGGSGKQGVGGSGKAGIGGSGVLGVGGSGVLGVGGSGALGVGGSGALGVGGSGALGVGGSGALGVGGSGALGVGGSGTFGVGGSGVLGVGGSGTLGVGGSGI